jgi:hypothetical protein
MFVAQSGMCGITHVNFEQRCRAGIESCISCELNLRRALNYFRSGQDIDTDRSTTALTTSHGYTLSASVTAFLKAAKPCISLHAIFLLPDGRANRSVDEATAFESK